MIFGIGADIAKVSRFEKWACDEYLQKRFFHADEIKNTGTRLMQAEHYASRFAAKEAFAKALGVGFRGFSLAEVCVSADEYGKPFFKLEGKAQQLVLKKCGKDAKIFLTLSHEKEFALAFVVIEV